MASLSFQVSHSSSLPKILLGQLPVSAFSSSWFQTLLIRPRNIQNTQYTSTLLGTFVLVWSTKCGASCLFLEISYTIIRIGVRTPSTYAALHHSQGGSLHRRLYCTHNHIRDRGQDITESTIMAVLQYCSCLVNVMGLSMCIRYHINDLD